MKKIIFLFFILTITNKINLAPDPLSKIEITSDKAICQKDKNIKNTFVFKYLENVNVVLADNSKIKSNELEIIIDANKTKNKIESQDNKITNTKNTTKAHDVSVVKKITFKDKVHLVSNNKIIDSDLAEIYPETKACNLYGNIKIEQKKVTPKDLPIVTNCQQASLNLQTEEITLQGTQDKPVSTIIEIAGKQGLFKKIKTKEEKKAEKFFVNKKSKHFKDVGTRS